MSAPGALPAGEPGWRWHLDRAAALALVVVLPLHVVLHVVLGAQDLSVATTLQRWDDPTWRVLDLSLVVLGLYHGTVGLRRLGPGRSVLVRGLRVALPWAAGALGLAVAAASLTG